MPHVKISIGGRNFDVACHEGEEAFLQTAAAMLDVEASAFVSQSGRIPEGQMLLMSGLMLADKTAGLEDQVRELQAQLKEAEAQMEAQRKSPKTIEVPVVPPQLTDSLAELAAQAEALADELDDKLAEAAG